MRGARHGRDSGRLRARRVARGTQAQVLADMAHDKMLEPGWEHGTGTHTRMHRLVRQPLDERQQRGIGIPPRERLERDGSRVLGPRQRPREPLGRRQAQDLLVVNALRVGVGVVQGQKLPPPAGHGRSRATLMRVPPLRCAPRAVPVRSTASSRRGSAGSAAPRAATGW